MSAAALREFLTQQIARAKAEGVLFSLQVKATMMRVSDPIIFGHAVQAFFPRLFSEYGEALAAVGGDPDEGLGAILQAAREAPGRPACRGRSCRSRGISPTARHSPWSIPATGSPACTSPAT